MMETLMARLRDGAELTDAEVARACAALLDESAGVEGRAEFLRALARKGETAGEIAAFVRTLLGHARGIEVAAEGGPLLDVCGTGGDKHGLFNISTAVMFVAAAAGARVAKHGNRGVTSRCGGADVLEALGVRIDLEPERAAAVLAEVGCVFLFAPIYHPAFRAIAPVRRFLAERRQPTVFNKLGPLLNPARPAFQLAGVFEPGMTELYAGVFAALGRERAWAVHGEVGLGEEGAVGPDGVARGGLDEMSTLGLTRGCAVEAGEIRRLELDAGAYGIRRPELAELVGGDAAHNARLLEALLGGRLEGAIPDMVAWNAAGALVVAGLAADMGAGLARAREAVASGAASGKLAALRAA